MKEHLQDKADTCGKDITSPGFFLSVNLQAFLVNCCD